MTEGANNKKTWTATERQARIEAIKNKIKECKKLSKEEVYKFALSEFGLSIRVIDEYLKELSLLGLIEILVNGDTEYKTIIEWRGGK
jgi:hypothetical protein